MEQWSLLIIFALAAFLRLYRLPDVPAGLHADEAMNGINALEAWRSGHFEVFYAENGGREGLFINLQAVALGLIGQNEAWVLRLVSAVLGIFTVVGFYYFCREIFDEATGRLAALFLATSVWHITLSRLGTRPIASLFFFVWATFLLWRGIRRLAEGGRWYWVDAIGGGLLFGLGFHTYTVFRIAPLLVLTLAPMMVRRFGWRSVTRVAVIFSVMAVVAVLPIALYFLDHQAVFLQRAKEISLFSARHPWHGLFYNLRKTAGMYNLAGDENWRHNIAGKPMLAWPVGLLFLVGTGLAVWRHRWLVAFWIVAALPCLLTMDGVPHSLRTILTLPAVLLAAALGGTWLWRWLVAKVPRIDGPVVPAALAVILAVAAYHRYFVEWAQNPVVAGWYDNDATMGARYLLALPKELPKYLVFVPEEAAYVRGLPSSARPIMFLTDTFTTARQQELHIHYLLPDQISQIETGHVYKVWVQVPAHL